MVESQFPVDVNMFQMIKVRLNNLPEDRGDETDLLFQP